MIIDRVREFLSVDPHVAPPDILPPVLEVIEDLGLGDGAGAPPPSSPSASTGGGGPNSTSVFLTPASLTFAGVSAVAGGILNFILGQWGGSRLWLSCAIAVVFGLVITLVGPVPPGGFGEKLKYYFIGFINTFMLWIGIFGVASLGDPSSGA